MNVKVLKISILLITISILYALHDQRSYKYNSVYKTLINNA